MQRTKTSSVPVKAETIPRQPHLLQEHSLSVLETKLAKIHNPHRCVEMRHSWRSARTHPRQMTLLKRDEHTLKKLTKVQDANIKVGPRTYATTKPLTGLWVDTVRDDGARKVRWTTRGYEQTLERKRRLLFSNTSDDAHEKRFGEGSGSDPSPPLPKPCYVPRFGGGQSAHR